MKDPLENIEQQARGRNYESPPLHLWHPPLSGDIAIRIAADGSWYHEGSPITREALVRLFASILRREEDGHYYLVTPAEKWRIQVELHPLLVTDVEVVDDPARELQVTLNTGKQLLVGARHPLALEPSLDIPYIELEHGLTALFSRTAWYRLVDLAELRDGVPTVYSGAYSFELSGNPL
jgi:hypothetical protein